MADNYLIILIVFGPLFWKSRVVYVCRINNIKIGGTIVMTMIFMSISSIIYPDRAVGLCYGKKNPYILKGD